MSENIEVINVNGAEYTVSPKKPELKATNTAMFEYKPLGTDGYIYLTPKDADSNIDFTSINTMLITFSPTLYVRLSSVSSSGSGGNTVTVLVTKTSSSSVISTVFDTTKQQEDREYGPGAYNIAFSVRYEDANKRLLISPSFVFCGIDENGIHAYTSDKFYWGCSVQSIKVID